LTQARTSNAISMAQGRPNGCQVGRCFIGDTSFHCLGSRQFGAQFNPKSLALAQAPKQLRLKINHWRVLSLSSTVMTPVPHSQVRGRRQHVIFRAPGTRTWDQALINRLPALPVSQCQLRGRHCILYRQSQVYT
jgi:hypothetical protein